MFALRRRLGNRRVLKKWLGRFGFPTDTATLNTATARIAEPGPGVWTVSDAGNALSIVAGELVANDNFALLTPPVALARVTGRAILASYTWVTGGGADFQIAPVPGNGDDTFRIFGPSIRVQFSQTIANITAGVKYEVALVHRGVGSFMLIKGGVFTNWTLLWVNDVRSGTIGGQIVIGAVATTQAKLDNIRAGDLAVPWTTDYGIATTRLAGVRIDGDTFSHTADCLIEWVATNIAGGQTRLIFRRQDAVNRWQVPVGTTGLLELYDVVANVATQRASGGTVVAAGNRILVIAVGTTINIYSSNVLRCTYSSATNFQTATAGEVGSSGGVISDIIAWPRTPTLNEPSSYLLLDQFTTDKVPLLGRDMEPGPGRWAVVDTGNKASISGGTLVFSGGLGSPVWGDPGVWGQSLARVAGRAFLVTLSLPAVGDKKFGWSTNQFGNITGGLPGAYLPANVQVTAGGMQVGSFTPDTPTEFAAVLRSTGDFLLQKIGGVWTLLWVNAAGAQAALYPTIINNNAVNFKSDNARVGDLGGSWASDYGIAVNQATFDGVDGTAIVSLTPQIGPAWLVDSGTWVVLGNRIQQTAVSGRMTVQSGLANAIIEATFRDVVGNNASFFVLFRWTDVNNHWFAGYADAGGCVIYEVNAGVATQRASGPLTVVTNTDYRLLVVADGATVTLYANNVQICTYASASFNQAVTSHGIRQDAAQIRCDLFVVWPRTPALVEPSSYLLCDRFDTDQPAPLTQKPYTEQGAVGALAILDVASGIAISGGQLSLTGDSQTDHTKLVHAAGLGRLAGRALLFKRLSGTANCEFGWSTLPAGTWDSIYGIRLLGGGLVQLFTGTGPAIGLWDEYAIVLRGTGFFVVARLGVGPWLLQWIHNAGVESIVYAALQQFGNTPNVLDNVRVVDLGGQFASDYGIALTRTAMTAVDGTLLPAVVPDKGSAWVVPIGTIEINGNRARASAQVGGFAIGVQDAGSADVIIEGTLRWTSLTSDANYGLVFRYIDNQNYWMVTYSAAGNGFRIIEYVANVGNLRAFINPAGPTSNTDYRLVIIAQGASITTYLNNVAGPAYASAATGLTETKHGIQFGIVTVELIDDFIVWPRTVALPSGA